MMQSRHSWSDRLPTESTQHTSTTDTNTIGTKGAAHAVSDKRPPRSPVLSYSGGVGKALSDVDMRQLAHVALESRDSWKGVVRLVQSKEVASSIYTQLITHQSKQVAPLMCDELSVDR